MGKYQARDEQMNKYLAKFRELMVRFTKVNMEHVPRDQNSRVHIPAKLASTKRPKNNKSIIQETLTGYLTDIMEIEDGSWMDPIRRFLEGDLDGEAVASKEWRRKASHYMIVAGQLYRRGHGPPLPHIEMCVRVVVWWDHEISS